MISLDECGVSQGDLQNVPQVGSELQIVYLDFDGEKTVYRNETLDISLEADVRDSGMTEEQKLYILAELSAKYALEDIFFTIEKPDDDKEYSTVFIGQCDDFKQYGSFAGIAETIDQGNQIKNDNAFVFTDDMSDPDGIISVIEHEVGHIFDGTSHSAGNANLSDFAAIQYNEDENNDSVKKANDIGTVTGEVNIKGSSHWNEIDYDYFKFTAGASGTLTVSKNQSPYSYYLRLFDSSGNYLKGSSSSGSPFLTYNVVKGNTYYISVSTSSSYASLLSYTVSMSLASDSPVPPPTPTPSPVYRPDLELLWVSAFDANNYQCSVYNETDSVRIIFRVNNISTNTRSEACRAKVTVGNFVKYVNIPALEATEGKSIGFTIPCSSLGVGTHSISAVVDCDATVVELLETNNRAAGEVMVTVVSNAKPDLIVSSFEPSGSTIAREDDLTFNVTISNVGNADAGAFSVSLCEPKCLYDSYSIPSLAAGQSVTKSITIPAGKLVAGTHSFFVVADSGNTVTESNENNNQSSSVNVVVKNDESSDLVFHTPSGWSDSFIVSTEKGTSSNSASFTENDTVYLDFCVKNIGNAYTGKAVYVDIFVDDAKVDYWLCSAGLDSQDTYSWLDKSIGKLSAGNHTIKLQIRQDDLEKVIDNNTVSKNITVVEAPVVSVDYGISLSVKNGALFIDWNDVPAGDCAGYQIVFSSDKAGGPAPVPVDVSESCYSSSFSETRTRNLSFKIRHVGTNGRYSEWSESCHITLLSRTPTGYTVIGSFDNEAACFTFSSGGSSATVKVDSGVLDIYSLPDWICKVAAFTEGSAEQLLELNLAADLQKNSVLEFLSESNGYDDVFWGVAKGTWDKQYYAAHHGVKFGWDGTDDLVSLAGKNKISDLFFGSEDDNQLILTDDANGDALFLEDMYSGLGNQARIANIDVIYAGAGEDIVDLTSRNFDFETKDMLICGGDGDDTIWGNCGANFLYGDAGADWIIGGIDADLIVGGSGNDVLHGGGGNDFFTFGGNWGHDTVQQIETFDVVLWIGYGSRANWDAASLTYNDGENSIKVTGVSAENVILIFGDDIGEDMYALYESCGAFAESVSSCNFSVNSREMLA